MAKLSPGVQLGDYVLGQPLWPLRIADAYRATGPAGACTIYVIHGRIAANPEVRDHIIAGARNAAALPEHKHLVRTIAAGLTGDVLWIATEEVDGSSVRDLLIKKRQQGAAGFGTRGTANLIAGVTAALAEVHHGSLATESVVVSRTGRVRVVDLALGPGTAAAMFAQLIAPHSSMAPELLSGGLPSGPGDVYAVGALLYEALVGRPLERGGPRPSEVVEGTNRQIDEVVARACHRDPDKRFGRADVLGEVVAESLAKGGAMMTHAVPLLEKSEVLEQQVKSLASELGPGSPSPAGSGSGIDRVLATALADSTEKWLVTKGRLDYGPFSLADIVSQIESGHIAAGDLIMDKDTGARCDVGEHPLLGPMVDQARAKRDEQRRAQAEVKVQSRDKKRGAVLYGLILAGLAGVGIGVYFLVADVIIKSDDKKVEVSELEGASLQVKVSEPKAPPRKHTGGGGRRTGGGGGGVAANASENLALDMSDENDETQTLDMGTVFRVYSKAGGRLGGCLQRTGEGTANISIIIDGPSGRINWVKVNGKQAGALYGCLGGVLRSLQFPSIHGPRTRAEFDIAM